MPMLRRSGGTTPLTLEMSRSPDQISPPSGRAKPASRLSVVVLPHPDGPSSATSSPSSMHRSIPDKAAVSPKRRRRFLIVMRAMLLHLTGVAAGQHAAAEQSIRHRHQDKGQP